MSVCLEWICAFRKLSYLDNRQILKRNCVGNILRYTWTPEFFKCQLVVTHCWYIISITLNKHNTFLQLKDNLYTYLFWQYAAQGLNAGIQAGGNPVLLFRRLTCPMIIYFTREFWMVFGILRLSKPMHFIAIFFPEKIGVVSWDHCELRIYVNEYQPTGKCSLLWSSNRNQRFIINSSLFIVLHDFHLFCMYPVLLLKYAATFYFLKLQVTFVSKVRLFYKNVNLIQRHSPCLLLWFCSTNNKRFLSVWKYAAPMYDLQCVT